MAPNDRYQIIDLEIPNRVMNMSADEIQLMLMLAERHRDSIKACPKCNGTMAATYKQEFVCGCGYCG